jgi:hypothetical protein
MVSWNGEIMRSYLAQVMGNWERTEDGAMETMAENSGETTSRAGMQTKQRASPGFHFISSG